VPDGTEGTFEGVAIVGLAGRFPGARDAAAFWRNLCAGVESIAALAPSDLEDAFEPAVRSGEDFVRARGLLDDADRFDAAFFGMQPREAELTDPQHRILLETCWEALEDAGYDPADYPKAIGIYAGCSISTYFLRHVLRDRAAVEAFASDYQVDSFSELLGSGADFLATRVAYKLNLRGPAMTVQSACSTSLLAVAQACQTLWLRQADMMLAGAVSISFPQRRGYVYQDGGMVSRDGHCRTFDADSSGTVFGAGAGVVVLKRLSDARRDGDNVYAVIRGAGVNNDGSAKIGYSAPSVDAQSAAIAAAHAMAGFEPATIDYVECHGTATPLGDPIEIAALAKAFGSTGAGGKRCALGSVKPNVGHLDVAAGMAGLIKTALALRHGILPATLHFSAPNPHIDFDATPFYVNAELAAWPAESPTRRAGVSAFGIGGTNVHLVLESEPVPEPLDAKPNPQRLDVEPKLQRLDVELKSENVDSETQPRRVDGEPKAQLLVISARSDAVLAESSARLAAHLRANPDVALEDVAFTLQSGRRRFARRRFVTAASHAEAIAKLEARHAPGEARGAVAGGGRSGDAVIAFMFPGQGSQFVGMGRGLYATQREFRGAVDRCSEIARPFLGADLRDLLYPDVEDECATRALTATAIAQPALFAIEYALARLWMSLGIAPVAMLGHSVGEFVAATLAGVFELDDALRIVVERGRLMQALPGGAMLAVRMSEAEIGELLQSGEFPSLALAALNAPRQSVVSGTHVDVAAIELALERRDVACKRVETTHAFHSPLMEPVRAPLEELIGGLHLAPPTRPYVSTLTGRWIEDDEATSPEYWAAHALEPVRFNAALTTLLESGVNVLLESGPGIALGSAARQGAAREAGCTILGSPASGVSNEASCASSVASGLLETLGGLWAAGASPDWRSLHAGHAPRRVSLPTYPFERKRFWLESLTPVPAEAPHVNGKTSLGIQPELAALRPELAPLQAELAALQAELAALLEELSGEVVAAEQWGASFLELGFDSLFLGRFVQQLNARYGVKLTFRQLLGDVPSLDALATRIQAETPARISVLASNSVTAHPVEFAGASAAGPVLPAVTAGTLEAVMREQLATMQALMREQLALLSGTPTPVVPTSAASIAAAPAAAPVAAVPSNNGAGATEARFEAFRVNGSGAGELAQAQREHVAALIARVNAQTPKSKAYAQRYRAVLADPRVAAGFRAEWKEMVYPIVCDRAEGSKLWDIDGNEYVDLLNGFGQTAFGHAPDFVVREVGDRLSRGFAIGPQSDLAGETAELFCKLTGNERMTFCNTGSEAVMAALRVARTVTGRNRVVVFDGAYHGQFDEVLVKSARGSRRSIAVAAGIPAEAVANVTVLDYGSAESLGWIREHAAELAAVVVEPVQSRRPALQPKEFLHALRSITAASGTALVFDEVVTGFRMHPGGMQAVFDVRADLATYGKVVGGGLPIGILAGTARFMNALDGGMWQYGDASVPEVPPTFFAGTFVRHPLALASVLAVLRHLEAQGPALQETLSERTAELVGRLNLELERRALSGRIESYGSLFYFDFTHEERLAGLLYYHLRSRGVYIQQGFPCFLTTAHSAADREHVVRAFADALDELQSAGIFTREGHVSNDRVVEGHVSNGRVASSVQGAVVEIPLTEAQTEIWLAAQLGDDASCAFNESITLRMRGALDAGAFAEALDAVIARHEALRASYGVTGETMRIAAPRPLAFQMDDLSAGGKPAAEAALAEYVARDARTPFDLSDGPPVRARLFRLSADEHAFVFSAHHIACDGWSMNVILGELAETYAAACRGTEPELPEPLAFSAYARRAAARDRLQATEVAAFWRGRFAQPVRPLELPTDRARPALRSFDGATCSLHLDANRTSAIKKAGARQGCTLFVTLLAAFDALIGRLADCDDLVVGIPAAGQALLDDEILVGHCVDFLPVRSSWTRDANFSDLLAGVKRDVLDAYEHQNYTLGTLVRELDLPRGTNRVPLAEIQFNLERLAEGLDLPGLAVEVSPNPKAFVNFDLFLNAIESRDGLRFDCDYNATLFDAATIERWLREYCAILDVIVEDPAAHVSVDPSLGASDLDGVPSALAGIPSALAGVPSALAGVPSALAGVPSALAGETVAARPDATVHALFEAQAAARPDALAASCGELELTYAELERRANQLAQYIQARTGGSGKLVGIALERSLDMLVALLATLKAGCAYVPLDPKHPPARLRHILDDAGVAALIVDATVDAALVPPGTPVIDLARDAAAIAAESSTAPLSRRSAADLAYVIYTSGSTGLPKGVEIEHGSVVNLLEAMASRPGLAARDVFLAVTTIAFDIAALELFLPLAVGARVVIAAPDEIADGVRLLHRLERVRATALQATPATWRLLLEAGFRAGEGFKMLCGGEALRFDLAARLLEGEGELWNMYGPTETTIWSTCARIVEPGSVNAGTPIANTQAYVLDGDSRLIRRGESGQLHLAGAGLARGYVGKPELTAEKFAPNPFGAGRLYATGDRARISSAGEIEILGRIDQQVKLRGFRIELGEIEAALAQTGALAAAAVALREDVPDQPRLVAYYVERAASPVAPPALVGSPVTPTSLQGSPMTTSELQAELAAVLPAYMIPTTWVRLDALPLTPNGKLDRSALPAPVAAPLWADASPAPLTATERALASICEEVLHLDRVGTADDLFALGADSIQLFQITARANRDGMRVAAKHVFAHRTIGALARHVDLAQTASPAS
jgi:amino acid adenylation domain-containing protein